MSNIRYDMGTNFASYGITLQRTITDILNKIGISDEGIKWVIFDEKKFMKNSLLPSIPTFYLEKDYKYGFCNIDKKEIWISTAAIMRAPLYDIPDVMKKVLPTKMNNFLVNVILDELAHIVTKKNHGNKIYDDKLMSYYRCYYGNGISGVNTNNTISEILRKKSLGFMGVSIPRLY